MRNQEQIFGRLAALEKNSYMYAHSDHRPQPVRIPPPPRHAPPMLDSFLDLSFDSPGGPIMPRNIPPAYIPPPPAHVASHDPQPTPLSPYIPPRLEESDDYLELSTFGDENDGADLTLSITIHHHSP